MKPITREEIEHAQAVLRQYGIGGTPLQSLQHIVQLEYGEVLGKCEDENEIGSYKIRGALYAISQLSEEQKKQGVVCASAGNHAQGVARACSLLGIKGTIFMPKTTDPIKIQRVKNLGKGGIEIRLVGDIFDDAQQAAREFQEQEKAVFIHPFDDRDVIIGQATVTAEILEQDPDIETLVVPVGGGGLLSGAIAAAQVFGKKALTIIGVEPSGARSMQNALENGTNAPLPKVNGFVGGAAVAQVGENTFATVRDAGIQVVSVPEGLVADTMLQFHNHGEVVEPAGALGSAGVRLLSDKMRGKVATIITGRCFNPELWPYVVDLAEKFRGEKIILDIKLPDRPGALKELLDRLHMDSVNIRVFQFDDEHAIDPPARIVLKGDSSGIRDILKKLQEAGFAYSVVE